MNEIDMSALHRISYGLYVISSHIDDKLNAQIANTVFQVCADPPMLCTSINKDNLTHEYIKESGVWAASVLDENTPFKFIGLLGFRGGRDLDKMSQIEHKIGVTGAPLIIENCLAALEVEVKEEMDAVTHTIFLGELIAAEVMREGNPLTYKYYHEVIKGKTPEKAATYQKG